MLASRDGGRGGGRSGGGGGSGDGPALYDLASRIGKMEARIDIVEERLDRIEAKLKKLDDISVELARISERLSHTPTKADMYLAMFKSAAWMVGIIATSTAIIVRWEQISAVVGFTAG